MTPAQRGGALVGAHVSIAGGLDKAFERGTESGCSAIQVFTRNASRWQAKPLTDEQIEVFCRARKEHSDIRYVSAHDSYLINLASPDRQLRRKSIETFLDELGRCHLLGIRDLVMHPGAHMGRGTAAGIATVIESFLEIFSEAPPDVRVLLENTAGQGTCLGARIEELAEIISRVPEGNFAVCFDTCHAFAAGYDLSSYNGYHQVMEQFDRLIGYRNLALVHANDSRKELGSRVDRHAHVGQGFIGREGFRALMQDRKLQSVAKIIETPGGENYRHTLEDLALLRALANEGSRVA